MNFQLSSAIIFGTQQDEVVMAIKYVFRFEIMPLT